METSESASKALFCWVTSEMINARAICFHSHRTRGCPAETIYNFSWQTSATRKGWRPGNANPYRFRMQAHTVTLLLLGERDSWAEHRPLLWVWLDGKVSILACSGCTGAQLAGWGALHSLELGTDPFLSPSHSGNRIFQSDTGTFKNSHGLD